MFSRSLLGCIPILTSFSVLSMMSGFVAFAYYWGCDPLFINKIETRDQVGLHIYLISFTFKMNH